MRLINVHTLELEEFFDENIPTYAILSHTWGKDEVTFQDLCWLADYDKNRTTYASLEGLLSQLGQNMQAKADSIRQRSGYDKIVQSARLAEEKDLEYVWVDTCCIDKTSSSELSEAINSMFRWYEESFVCFAFLSDVDLTDNTPGGVRFEDSRWFTRGWTLQELLAPWELWFYNVQWTEIGYRDYMADRLHDITSIPKSALRRDWTRRLSKGTFSLAQRMSWASKRKTSRKEDMAYCLLGLFDINMPLLYGEGEKAFVRLQQEIIKSFSGQSLLAWGMNRPLRGTRWYSPTTLLAPSPAAFAGTSVLDTIESHGVPFQLNNRGLQIPLNIFEVVQAGIYYAQWDILLEQDNVEGDRLCLCLPLLCMGNRRGYKHMEDGQELIRGASPVPVAHSRLPLSRSRKKILVVESHQQKLELTDDFRYVEFLATIPFSEGVEAVMVESFPPLFSSKIYCVDFTKGIVLFRYVIPNAHAAGLMSAKGHLVDQFVVVVDIEILEQGSEIRYPAFKSTTAVCAWTGYSGHRAGNHGGRYVSLVDAFLGGEKLLDMRHWLDERILYPNTALSVGANVRRDLEDRVVISMSIRFLDKDGLF